MGVAYFTQGMILGLSVASTIGVSGVLCLQNMMSGNTRIALASALASALADMTCGIIVVFGMKALQSTLIFYGWYLQAFVGLFLCGLGLRKIFAKVVMTVHHEPSPHTLAAFGSIYFLSIVDPVSMVDFLALCLGLTLEFSVVYHAIRFIVGLFVGSAAWWLSLCFLSVVLRSRISAVALQYVQQIIGALIFGFGLVTISKLL